MPGSVLDVFVVIGVVVSALVVGYLVFFAVLIVASRYFNPD